jgi:transcriptional regulator with XRE-family HTH domain
MLYLKGGNASMLTANESNIHKQSFGERLAALRESHGMKRQALSDALGGIPSRSAIEQLEKGLTEPRAHTILALSSYFGVSADYLLTGSSPENLGSYLELGLNDEALALWESQIDAAKSSDKFAAFSHVLNSIMSDNRFFHLFWGLLNLNTELAAIDDEIAAAKAESPDTTGDTPDALLADMQLGNKLEPLQERRDLLILRYIRQVEKLFTAYVKGDSE